MTIILSLETSTEIASVALLTPNEIFSVDLNGVQTHSLGLLPAIQSLLGNAQLDIKQCHLIAYGCGPGAFTGVRTACGVVQGLAFGLDIPVVPVSSLLAMAQAAYVEVKETNFTDFVCILDARMGEVYWAHYRYVDNIWGEISVPQLSKLEAVVEYVENVKKDVKQSKNTYLGKTNFVSFVLGNGVDSTYFKNDAQIQLVMPNARDVASLALIDYKNNHFTQAENAQPLYLRNKVALTSLERASEKSKNA
jgi:tRNA threonylcarbamoyladenosine biosynthesis protein TsaB